MKLLKKSKNFYSIKSLSSEEYIYLLNYINELIKKYNQGLLGPILQDFFILIIKENHNNFTDFITTLLTHLKIFECKITMSNNFFFLEDFYDLKIVVTTRNIESPENAEIYITPETFSALLAISSIINYANEEDNESKSFSYKIDENFINKTVVDNIVKIVFTQKKYIEFLKNKELKEKIEITFLPLKEIFFTLLGLIIIIIRENL